MRRIVLGVVVVGSGALVAVVANGVVRRWQYGPVECEAPEGPVLVVERAVDCEAPEGWVLVAERGFPFRAPGDLRRDEDYPHGIDAYIGVYRSEALFVYFNYSWNANPLSQWPGEWVRLDGRRARVASLSASEFVAGYGRGVGVHIPDAGRGNSLTLSVYARSEPDMDAARTLIGTVRVP